MDKKDKKIMEACIELAKQGIDIEEVCKSLEPLFDVCKQIVELAIKNYKFIKGGVNNDNT